MNYDDKKEQLEESVKNAESRLELTKKLVNDAQGSDSDICEAMRELEEAEYRLSRHLISDEQE